MYVVVTYDVSDDRRRERLAEALLEFVGRVQKSVFEGEIPDGRLEALREAVRGKIDLGVDNVRIYRLCGRCREATEMVGTAAPAEERGDEIF